MQTLFQDKDEPEIAAAKRHAVLLPYPLEKAYDYAAPEGVEIGPGDYVRVPLGKREIPGMVWSAADGDVSPAKLKSIVSKYDLPPLPEVHRKFIDWVASYTMAARGAVLKMTLSVPKAMETPKPIMGYRLFSSPLRGEGRVGGPPYKPKPPSQLIARSQTLRAELTEPEKKLWFQINKEQLGVKFRRQHPVAPYIADFACIEKKIIIELDGVTHDGREDYDATRTRFLEADGYKVLRFRNNEVMENMEGVLQIIMAEIQQRSSGLPPHSNPPPVGGRESKGANNSLPPQVGGGLGWGEISPQYQRVIDILANGKTYRPAELAALTGVSVAALKTMAKKGLIEQTEIKSAAPCRAPDIVNQGPALSPDKAAAAAQLKDMVRENTYAAVLLDGVTGAGKTEVYFEAVAETLKQGKQVLILLPEIALSNAFIDRFKSRFGCAPALWHSNLSPAQRRNTWRGVAQGETKVISGARSALFLPYQNLGLIIVDEEHDPAYKQEEGVIYHARDMAVVRAHMGKIPVVLVSATPSLETIHNAWNGRYRHLHLPDRFGGARLPDIEIVDMRSDKPERQHFISPTLKKALEENLSNGEQSLLFLNRRGYAPLTLCRACGHRMECPRCTSWLVEHKKSGNLHCHHCAFEMRIPKTCPSCNAADSFVVCGPGVERIHEEAKAAFPAARTLVLASDTAENPDHLRAMLNDIRAGNVDIIIGTQIIAKGHHFPQLTCVGVIDADLGLNGGELRAAERTYQLLHQVAGRAGREQKKGKVYLQTFMPEHRIMKALSNEQRDKFLEVEAYEREHAHMPPYARLAGIIVAGRDDSETKYIAQTLGKSAPQMEGFQTLGPAPAPLARLRGKFRYRLLVRADKNLNIQKTIGAWLEGVKIPSTVKVAIDIDPQSFSEKAPP